METCIVLRTAILHKKYVCSPGVGIVADSKPEKEYQETVNKAKALFKGSSKRNRARNINVFTNR